MPGGLGEIRTRDQRIKSQQKRIFLNIDLLFQDLIIFEIINKYKALLPVINLPQNSIQLT